MIYIIWTILYDFHIMDYRMLYMDLSLILYASYWMVHMICNLQYGAYYMVKKPSLYFIDYIIKSM